ncbi:MAG: tRNA threonylcarbamoyladenosine dehydratase [Firmicutes bacterium]|nr:tRNA threonylcarbamoyladenosine dehydratase [Bacillota bacterium]
MNQFSRSELLLGREVMANLSRMKILIFGIGGVGSYVCEALVRSGVKNFVLVDSDKISLTNVNRQIHATLKTVGRSKVEVMKERMLEINPECNITIFEEFYLPDNHSNIINDDIDYIVDAIDTISAKIDIIVEAKKKNIPIISAMGAGNKFDPTRFEVTDIYKTSVCPLAKVMRRELKKRKITSLKVVYSKEEPIEILDYSCCIEDMDKKRVPGSLAFVPSSMGLIIASEIVKDVINK